MFRFETESCSIEVDLTEAEQELRKIEGLCRLKAENGRMQTTVPFLESVASWLKCRGLVDATCTTAWQFWWTVFDCIDTLRQRHQNDAELAYWFKVNPFGISAEQRAGLMANLPRVQAQGILHEGNFEATDPARVYALVLLATGDEAAAIKARGDAAERLIEAKTNRGAA